MADAPEALPKVRGAGVDFLLADLDMALTFMEVAALSGSEERKKRNHKKAHEAYRMVLRLLDTVSPDAPQRTAIIEKLALLKERLEKAGDRF